jgi:very-short-patch-repair endonuclease
VDESSDDLLERDTLRRVERVFVGSEALARGVLTRHELRTLYRRVLPDVYTANRTVLTLEDRTVAAWLWSGREGVVKGLAASAILGAKWVDDDIPIELNWANHRPPTGVVTRNDTLLEPEVARHGPMAVTTPDRTAFDLGCRGPVGQAVARLDSLARATHFKVADVQELALRHPHVKGLRQLDRVLDLVDAGAESPQETRIRLMLMDAGLPRPQTQIPVRAPDGHPRYYLDMGWEDVMVAVEYDGRHHTDRPVYSRDIIRLEYVNAVGWTVVRVVAEHRRAEIAHRVRQAWGLRLR